MIFQTNEKHHQLRLLWAIWLILLYSSFGCFGPFMQPKLQLADKWISELEKWNINLGSQNFLLVMKEEPLNYSKSNPITIAEASKLETKPKSIPEEHHAYPTSPQSSYGTLQSTLGSTVTEPTPSPFCIGSNNQLHLASGPSVEVKITELSVAHQS